MFVLLQLIFQAKILICKNSSTILNFYIIIKLFINLEK